MFCSLSAGTRLARLSLDKRFQTAQSLWMSIISLQGFESQGSQTPSRHFKMVLPIRNLFKRTLGHKDIGSQPLFQKKRTYGHKDTGPQRHQATKLGFRVL